MTASSSPWPQRMLAGASPRVRFAELDQDLADLGPLTEARFERGLTTLTRWQARADGSLAPIREDVLGDRLDLLFTARAWTPLIVRLASLGPPLRGRAEVRVAPGGGPELVWAAQALLAPRSGPCALAAGTWLGVALRLTLLAPPLSLVLSPLPEETAP
ncbi:hypothetical protein CKO38_14780 [Rhodospirillum rubrum]|uniref:hypothetical protein n=1 Tax=Rhodospirillum rubrum TaxID=1085 RepID=UPI00190778F9|nr:hypothetical protein [Rhodospirillum rubrum]MBK1666300.1 hypothetical protein [Rhodospirillum rubrum]MBK1677912.1 hypothetical protein [Rhodospirillum rubrum]